MLDGRNVPYMTFYKLAVVFCLLEIKFKIAAAIF